MDKKSGVLPVFTTGQFAKLCGVKKDTLFHYDDIGLLKPHEVRENGYRCYSAMQLNRFRAISILRDSGFPLEQIKQLLEDYSPTEMLELFGQVQQQLKEQIRRTQHLVTQMQNTMSAMHFALASPMFEPRLDVLEGAKLAAVPTGEGRADHKTRIHMVSELYRFSMNSNSPADFLRGGIITRAYLEQGVFSTDDMYLDYLCSKLLREEDPALADLDGKNILEQPAGLYAIINCPGGEENSIRALEVLTRFIRDSDCRIAGNGYEFELLGYFFSEDAENSVKQIEIHVEKG